MPIVDRTGVRARTGSRSWGTGGEAIVGHVHVGASPRFAAGSRQLREARMGMFDWIFGTRRDRDMLEFARRVAVESRAGVAADRRASGPTRQSPRSAGLHSCAGQASRASPARCGWSIVTVGCPSSGNRRFSNGLWSFSPAILRDRCCVSSRLSRRSAEPRRLFAASGACCGS